LLCKKIKIQKKVKRDDNNNKESPCVLNKNNIRLVIFAVYSGREEFLKFRGIFLIPDPLAKISETGLFYAMGFPFISLPRGIAD